MIKNIRRCSVDVDFREVLRKTSVPHAFINLLRYHLLETTGPKDSSTVPRRIARSYLWSAEVRK